MLYFIMYNFAEDIFLKKFIERIKDLHYRRRLLKWVLINIKLAWRKMVRFFKGDAFLSFVKSTPVIICYIAIGVIVLTSVGTVCFEKFAYPVFDPSKKTISALSGIANKNSEVAQTLKMLGSSDKLQISLATDNEKVFNKKGVDLDNGNLNLLITFLDGKKQEYPLINNKYDTFEAGATDLFTITLPSGKTVFDIAEYRLIILPGINNKYDDWHCKWARVYFLLGGEPVLVAKESWKDSAVFGSGDSAIKQSQLTPVAKDTTIFKRSNELFDYFLKLNKSGIDADELAKLKEKTLDAVGINSGRVLCVDIETVNIEGQNNILTYYTKGVEISEYDSLDYDGLLNLELSFYTPLKNGSYNYTVELDTLGTDDFELGSTSQFKIELPEGLTVFDISRAVLKTDNPYDAWSPRFVRVYVETDYKEKLEIARITDAILTSTYSTPVFYKNLIDGGVELDLSSSFCISNAQRKALEQKNGYSFKSRIGDMYYKLQSFYSRQNAFFDIAVDIYTKTTKE